MNATHHDLDPYPVPADRKPMFINEPWVIDEFCDQSMINDKDKAKMPDTESDNIRVYVPIDLNKKSILRRLHNIIAQFGEANESNEFHYSSEIQKLIYQIEIYDQIWFARHWIDGKEHSVEAIELVKEFVAALEDIPDGCSECFPFDVIEYLKSEYL